MNKRKKNISFVFILAAYIGLAGCSSHQEFDEWALPTDSTKSNSEKKEAENYSVPPPPLSDLFPCSDCHAELETNKTRRVLTEMHDEIVFNHDSEHRWCLDCHDAEYRDSLHLASGIRIAFAESHRLCGQCHGDKYRDWKIGIHGKRTGEWNGKKQYLLCVHCHDQHSPKFKNLVPLPPPRKPNKEFDIDSIVVDSLHE